MLIRSLKHGAAAAALAGVISLAAVSSGSAAHWGRGVGPGIGAGVAGFALGAAAGAAAAPYYGYGYPYGGGYYDYAPDAVTVAPGYYDYAPGYTDGQWRRPGDCHFSIRNC